jgi:hypothetical protein
MNKRRIAYIDENRDEISKFQRRVYDAFDVLEFLPKGDFDNFVDELLDSGAEAFVSDFYLNEYRNDVKEAIQYSGADLIEKLLNIRRDFPCFVLTSHDNAAIDRMTDVNYVYSKEVLTEDKQTEKFIGKIRAQIEHYNTNIELFSNRFFDLQEKSMERDLTEDEENELLALDTILENSLNKSRALPAEKKNQLAIGKINELLSSTNELLNLLRDRNKK